MENVICIMIKGARDSFWSAFSTRSEAIEVIQLHVKVTNDSIWWIFVLMSSGPFPRE